MGTYFPPTYQGPEYGLSDEVEEVVRLLQTLPLRTRRAFLIRQRESTRELPEARRNRRFLYRYLAMDPDASNREFENRKLEDLLVRGELYLSPLHQFNDPNEFRARLIMNPDPAAQRRWLTKDTGKELIEWPREKWKRKRLEARLLDDAKRRLRDEPEALQHAYEGRAGGFGIACFSQNPRSTLMWSHYAKSHKGICIQFDFSQCPGVLSWAKLVDYRDDLPNIPWPDQQHRVMDGILGKAREWSYEAERRYVSGAVKGRTLRFDARSVTGILLGQRFDDDSRMRPWLEDVLMQRATRGLPHVKLYSATRHPERYSLRIQRDA